MTGQVCLTGHSWDEGVNCSSLTSRAGECRGTRQAKRADDYHEHRNVSAVVSHFLKALPESEMNPPGFVCPSHVAIQCGIHHVCSIPSSTPLHQLVVVAIPCCFTGLPFGARSCFSQKPSLT